MSKVQERKWASSWDDDGFTVGMLREMLEGVDDDTQIVIGKHTNSVGEVGFVLVGNMVGLFEEAEAPVLPTFVIDGTEFDDANHMTEVVDFVMRQIRQKHDGEIEDEDALRDEIENKLWRLKPNSSVTIYGVEIEKCDD